MKKNKYIIESIMKWLFFICSLISIISIILICYFIFKGGLPFIFDYGFTNFAFGTKWAPSNSTPSYGILPMIFGSFYTTVLSCLIGIPTGILTAAYMAKDCDKKLYKFLKPLVNLMAGIPSIIYGFFGMKLMVPLVRNIFGGQGISILTASLLLAIMILPTIINLSEAAINAVPRSFYEASVALGATHERSLYKVVIPAAKSGILAAVILGVGRSIGETMAVMMVAGSQPRITGNILKGIRTMTTNIVIEMAYSTGDHRLALIATATLLFVFILIVNLSFWFFKKRSAKQ